jgi:MFS transporter, ACS family, hexuronate transporter
MQLTRTHAWIIALAATLTMTVSYIDRQTLAVLGPAVTEALDMTDAEYGLLHSAFAFAYLVATPLCGWWLSRIGPRRGLVISVLVWSAVAASHALAPSFAVLFLMRIALGVTEGPSYPGSAQTIQNVLPPQDRSRGFGVLFSGSSIGGMIVPLLASAIFATWGWRAAFLVTSIVGLLWIPLWIVLTSHPAARARIDLKRDVVKGESFGTLLKSPAIHRALLGVFAAAPVVGLSLAWGAKYLDKTWAIKQQDVGGYLWLPPLLFDLGAIGFGDLVARIRRPRLLFGISAAMVAMVMVMPWAATPWQAVLLLSIGMAGGGGLYAMTVSEAYSRVSPTSVSMAGGLIACAQSIVFVTMNPVIGKVVDTYGHYDGIAIFIGAITIPFAAIWIGWPSPGPRASDARTP